MPTYIHINGYGNILVPYNSLMSFRSRYNKNQLRACRTLFRGLSRYQLRSQNQSFSTYPLEVGETRIRRKNISVKQKCGESKTIQPFGYAPASSEWRSKKKQGSKFEKRSWYRTIPLTHVINNVSVRGTCRYAFHFVVGVQRS